MRNALFLSLVMLALGCGDDESSSEGSGNSDGGVSPEELAALEDRIDGQDDELDGLGSEVEALDDAIATLGDDQASLGDDLEGLGGDVEGQGESLDSILDRLDEIETPDEPVLPEGLDAAIEAVEPILTAQCEKSFDCCDAGEQSYTLGPHVSNVEDCVERKLERLSLGQEPWFPLTDRTNLATARLLAAVNSESSGFALDEDAIEACAESIADSECDGPTNEGDDDACNDYDLYGVEQPCDGLVRGLREEGEACEDTEIDGSGNCTAGLVCRLGACAEPPQAGDACEDDGDCGAPDEFSPTQETDLFCNPETGMCEETREEGEPCAYERPDHWTIFGYSGLKRPRQHSGPVRIECKPGLMCDPLSLECVPYCTEGAICLADSGSNCGEGLVCNAASPKAGGDYYGIGSCRPPAENGDPCTNGSECASGYCHIVDIDELGECKDEPAADGEDCTLDTAGVAQMSEACASFWCASDGKCAANCNEAVCPSDRACLESSVGVPFCEAKIADDLACEETYPWRNLDESCASGFCDGADCKPVADEDGACGSGRDAQCPAGQYCAVDTCTDRGAAGADCTEDRECAADLYCGTAGTSASKCTALSGTGDACGETDDLRCEEDLSCITVGASSECHELGEYPVDADCSEDSECESGWCADGTCAEPLADGEDCNMGNAALDRCAADSYCNFELDQESNDYGKGQCEPRLSIGEACDPRHFVMIEWGAAKQDACVSNSPEYSQYSSFCQLTLGQWVCDANTLPPEESLCDGE